MTEAEDATQRRDVTREPVLCPQEGIEDVGSDIEAEPVEAVSGENGERQPGDDEPAFGPAARAHALRIEDHGRRTTGPTEAAAPRPDPSPS